MTTPVIPSELQELLKRLCAEVTWKAAATYPAHMAHACVLRANEPALYGALADAIATHGCDKRFYSRTYRYLELGNGYKHWAYDTLINRERLTLTRAREGKAAAQTRRTPA